MSEPLYTVVAVWDEEAEVWVATSDDVPGLVTEAPTEEALVDKLMVLIPELLEANGILPPERAGPVRILSVLRTRPPQRSIGCHPSRFPNRLPIPGVGSHDVSPAACGLRLQRPLA